MKHKLIFDNTNNRLILYKDQPILKSYNGYITDYNKTKKTQHYGELWREGKVYK